MWNFLSSYMTTYNNKFCSLKKKQRKYLFYSRLSTTTMPMTKLLIYSITKHYTTSVTTHNVKCDSKKDFMCKIVIL